MELDKSIFPPDQDFELVSFRNDIRHKKNYYYLIAINARNKLSEQSMESKFEGMETLYNMIKSGNITIKPNFLQAFHFYVLLHFYIHMIHSDNPNLQYLNYAIFLLQFPQIVDINDIYNLKKFEKDVSLKDPNKIQFPYPVTEKVQSLTQQDSIDFLLQGISNSIISESCFELLTMILKEKKRFYILNNSFFDIILENPDLQYGEIIYLYFEYCLKHDNLLRSNIRNFNNIFINILNSTNETNTLFMLKSMNSIISNSAQSEEYSPFLQEPYELLIERLPQLILTDSKKIIVQSLIFVSSLDSNLVSDSIILAIFHCLPINFKKMHDSAFEIIKINLDKIISLLDTSAIAEVFQGCFQSPQYNVKLHAHELLTQLMQSIPIIELIDIEDLFSFLDDPSMASMALPTIISSISAYEKSGNTQALLEVLSNNIDNINELADNEDENVAQMANNIISLYQNLSGN